MELIIDIPQELKNLMDTDCLVSLGQPLSYGIMIKAIKNGTVLPKGHGDLIDKKEVYKKFYCRCLAGVAEEVLKEVKTIIEADKEIENETDN